MRRFLAAFVGLFFGLLSPLPAAEGDPVALPALTARVVDTTATLAPDQQAELEGKLRAFEQRKGAQVVLVLVPTTQPESIEQFGTRLFEAWKIGRQGVDDGAILIVAKNDRKLRIEVGYGLEGALNDATAKRIIDETIAPRLRQGDFNGGLTAGLDAMLGVIDGEALPPPPAAVAGAPAGGHAASDNLVVVLLIAAAVGGSILRHLLGRLLGSSVTALLGGAAGWLIAGTLSGLLFGALAGFMLAMIGLRNLFQIFLSAGGSRSSGGGFGGFGGGGGRSGGGGASGGW